MYTPIKIPRQMGIHVRRTREAWGMTRIQLAKAAGVSERLVASLELGEAPGIRLDKLMAVLGALGMQLGVSESTGNITQEQPRDDVEDAHKLANIISSKTKNPSSSSEIASHAAVLRQFIVENYGIPDEQVGRVD